MATPRSRLRCLINDTDDKLQLETDDHVLTLDDLEKMLRTYAGDGMRIAIVPDGEIKQEPGIVAGESPFEGEAVFGDA